MGRRFCGYNYVPQKTSFISDHVQIEGASFEYCMQCAVMTTDVSPSGYEVAHGSI